MRGKFRNETIFSGVWKSTRPEVTYHGAFQLVVSADGRAMNGRWLGLSNSGSIRHGEWTLARIS
jgi:hypothetical protein